MCENGYVKTFRQFEDDKTKHSGEDGAKKKGPSRQDEKTVNSQLF